jgi:alkylation response protein AidB-like acyl-CoA dehydrogenase
MNDQRYTDIVALAREFVQGEVVGAVKEGDHYPDVPFRETLYEKAGEVGFLSFVLPEEVGGVGENAAALAEVLNEISKTDASVAAVMLCQAFAHRLLVDTGKEALAGKDGLMATTLYEDPAEQPIGVTAAEAGGSYRLKGKIEYVVLAPVARSFILPALLDGETALFLVEKGDGVIPGEPLLTLGLRACPVADLELEDAEGTLLSKGGDANTTYLEATHRLRGAVAAISAGIIAGCFEEARTYARDRYQGYKQIIDHQQMRAELGRIAINMLVARGLFQGVGSNHATATREPFPSAVQVMTGELAVESCILGVQILGGNGYMEDYGQEKRMRDAKQVQGVFGQKDLTLQDICEALAV